MRFVVSCCGLVPVDFLPIFFRVAWLALGHSLPQWQSNNPEEYGQISPVDPMININVYLYNQNKAQNTYVYITGQTVRAPRLCCTAPTHMNQWPAFHDTNEYNPNYQLKNNRWKKYWHNWVQSRGLEATRRHMKQARFEISFSYEIPFAWWIELRNMNYILIFIQSPGIETA